MISLDIDLSYLSRHYNIGSRALQQYRNMSIVQIMQAEAVKGNQAAAEFLLKLTSDPKQLEKIFQLANPKNRYLILKNMNQEDLMMIMQYLKPQDLVLGLSIFNQEKLIELMQKLPPETLANVVLSKMDSNKFLEALPEKFLDEFLSSDKLDKKMLLKAMEKVDEKELQKMMENISGKPCKENKNSIIDQMKTLSDDEFMESIGQFEIEGKRQLISGLLENKPELFEEFSKEAMTKPFEILPKEEILKSLTVLDTQELLPMVEDLPQEFMALIATQIDSEIFSEILCSEFADIIAKCGI